MTPCECGDKHVKFSASTKIKIYNYVQENQFLFRPTSIENETQATNFQKKPSMPNNKSVMCKICGKYYNRRSLNRHRQNVHERNEDTFKCPEKNCTKGFAYSFHLNRHINTVHKKRSKTKCDFCSKTYSDKWELKKHQIKCNRKNKSNY